MASLERSESTKSSFLELEEDEWARFILSIDEECSEEAKEMWKEYRVEIVEKVSLTEVQDQLVCDGVLNDEDNEKVSKR